MIAPINDGGPAFPVPSFIGPNGEMCDTGQYWDGNGMSLRAYFAGKALPAVITGMASGEIGEHPDMGGGPKGYAATACDIADAMIAELCPMSNQPGDDAIAT